MGCSPVAASFDQATAIFPFAFSPSATKQRMVWTLSVLVYDVIDSVQPDKANEDEIDGDRKAHARGASSRNTPETTEAIGNRAGVAGRYIRNL